MAYRIILVDDEEEVRKGIIRQIHWEDLGFEVVGDAENGEEALEKIEQLEPDVIMTDIRMPYMDGLTLISRVRQLYPSMKVLIFSGFDDFEYAQQAIKLNVAEYILKPVNSVELTEILNRVRENLDQEIEQRRNVDRLRESYQKNIPILRELFLNELVSGSIDEVLVQNRLREFGVDILGARKWLTAVLRVEQEGNVLSQHKELIPISVRQLMEDYLKGCFRFVIFNSKEGLTLLAAVDEENTQTGFISQLGDICKECRRILEAVVTIGVGHSCQELSQVKGSFQSAVDALGYRAIVGSGSVIYINDVEPIGRGRLQMDDKEEAELAGAIKFGTQEKMQAVAHRLMERMSDARVHQRQYQMFMLSIVNCLAQLMQQYELDSSQTARVQEQYARILNSEVSREEFEEWMLQSALQMREKMNLERDNTTRRLILEAKQYIHDHYQNPDLSVEMICRQFHMSPAYFSTMFKKETGQTYIGYLTDVRMARAVELLNETDDKTYVIAQKVGYQEQNYFSYVFKKKFGVSPTRYRGAQQRG